MEQLSSRPPYVVIARSKPAENEGDEEELLLVKVSVGRGANAWRLHSTMLCVTWGLVGRDLIGQEVHCLQGGDVLQCAM